jgi:hypothetical protein
LILSDFADAEEDENEPFRAIEIGRKKGKAHPQWTTDAPAQMIATTRTIRFLSSF